jgi:hypothetical protein
MKLLIDNDREQHRPQEITHAAKGEHHIDPKEEIDLIFRQRLLLFVGLTQFVADVEAIAKEKGGEEEEGEGVDHKNDDVGCC